ncbi:MAG: hypothetical protein R3330_09500, partial [Saprospiraceae bacterium]|nr:hypothetical protein [Saprospiraceae bacterium]
IGNYDLDKTIMLKDDRRINKVLKRASSYFGGPARAARELNLPETAVRDGIARQQQHSSSKIKTAHPLARLRRMLRRGMMR